ncbi:hypothetical protein CYMTET_19422 [Cymbomonas tetramitiformis]|uniref:Myosin motor domain-containing protein n=1 Tax=Cymbomonas tetramitiformis TaxID=36881 RepID=A0AAE0G615_9CHLO|nr:hypothetical protein CYMTET_19422 [Cymbomonas tetramitiformis]
MFAKGSWAWVPEASRHLYARAQITEDFSDGDPGEVKLEDGKVLKLSAAETALLLPASAPRANEQHYTQSDLVNLSPLNVAETLQNLKLRYNQDQIYTAIGPNVLISVNPFCELPIYTPDVLAAYLSADAETEPHVFGVAHKAYWQMREERCPQAVLISGESGAGKTECTKLILSYLIEVSKRSGQGARRPSVAQRRPSIISDDTGDDRSPAPGAIGVEESVLAQSIVFANVILEAFGNAKTVRNGNSSRYGKWLEVRFDDAGQVCGGTITNYLLEKTRVVTQAPDERNYHIFYHLWAHACSKGKGQAEFDELELGEGTTFGYMRHGDVKVAGLDDGAMFLEVVEAMEKIGLSPEQRAAVFRAVAGLLHLGNVTFTETETEGHQEGSRVVNPDVLQRAARLLEWPAADLESSLCWKMMQGQQGSSTYKMPNNVAKAQDVRDAICKRVYSQIFDWLTTKINAAIKGTSQNSASCKVGILDIFGFESFVENSFEQLCINYCNEKLQNHWNNFVFNSEIEEYQKEGVPFDTSSMQFNSNETCVELFEAKQPQPGIFQLIQDEVSGPKGSDEALVQKMLSSDLLKSGCLDRVPKRPHDFKVKHFAGDVAYRSEGMLEKNRDSMPFLNLEGGDTSFVQGLLLESALSEAFGGAQNSRDNKRRSGRLTTVSIASQFQKQMMLLVKILEAAQPHFVRCIKPTAAKIPNDYTEEMVRQQLQACGVLECCRLRAEGYPIKIKKEKFSQQYEMLLKTSGVSKDKLAVALQEAGHLNDKDWLDGASKVFLRDVAAVRLNSLRIEELDRRAVFVQKMVRGWLARKRLAALFEVMANLRLAVSNKNQAELEEGLASMAKMLPGEGKRHPLVRQAAEVLAALVEKQKALENLQHAAASRDMALLQSAIAHASSLGLGEAELEHAKQVLEGLAREEEMRTKVESALKVADLAALAGLMSDCERLGLTGLPEVQQAQAVLAKARRKDDVAKEVQAALSSKSVQQLEAALEQALQEELPKDIVEGVRQRLDLLRAEGRLREVVSGKELANLDVTLIREAVERLKLLMTGPAHGDTADLAALVEGSTALLASMERWGAVEQRLKAAYGSRAYKELEVELEEAAAAWDELEACRSKCGAGGATRQRAQTLVTNANALVAQLKRESDCIALLQQALKGGQEALEAALKKAGELGMSGAEVDTASARLDKLCKLDETITNALAARDLPALLAIQADAGASPHMGRVSAMITALQEEEELLVKLRQLARDGSDMDEIVNALAAVERLHLHTQAAEEVSAVEARLAMLKEAQRWKSQAAHVLEGADVVALEAAIAGVKAFTSQHSGHVALEQEVVNMETRLALIAQREALNTAAAQLLAQCLAEQQGNPMVLKAAREEELLQLLSRAAELELVSEKIAAAKSFLERVTHERQLEVKRKERLMESLQGRMGYLCNVINSKNDDGSDIEASGKLQEFLQSPEAELLERRSLRQARLVLKGGLGKEASNPRYWGNTLTREKFEEMWEAMMKLSRKDVSHWQRYSGLRRSRRREQVAGTARGTSKCSDWVAGIASRAPQCSDRVAGIARGSPQCSDQVAVIARGAPQCSDQAEDALPLLCHSEHIPTSSLLTGIPMSGSHLPAQVLQVRLLRLAQPPFLRPPVVEMVYLIDPATATWRVLRPGAGISLGNGN